MLEAIRTAFTKYFRPWSLSQDSLSRPHAAGCGFRRARSGRRLSRAAAALAESLETRRLLAAFVVDTLIDENDGVGVGGVSLRDASWTADAGRGAEADTITFAPALTAGGPATMTLTLGQLTLSDTRGTTTITGPGANLLSVSGNNVGRVFEIASNVTAELSGLTITRGNAAGTGLAPKPA